MGDGPRNEGHTLEQEILSPLPRVSTREAGDDGPLYEATEQLHEVIRLVTSDPRTLIKVTEEEGNRRTAEHCFEIRPGEQEE